eukprot:403366904
MNLIWKEDFVKKHEQEKEHSQMFIEQVSGKFDISELTQKDLIELNIMAKIKSKYLCQVNDYFISTKDQKLCIVQEIAKHGNLGEFCEKTYKDKQIPEDLVKQWLAQIALGLKELHSRNIIHRDIKPQNILVFEEDDVKIADYGLAKQVNEDTPLCFSVVGTMKYMSNEMKEKLPYDCSTDIFSLGVTLVYLLTQSFPYIIDSGQNHIPEINGYSEDLVHMILTMLNIRKELRPTVDDILSSPLIADTKAVKEFRQFFSVRNHCLDRDTLGRDKITANFNIIHDQNQIEQYVSGSQRSLHPDNVDLQTIVSPIPQIQRGNSIITIPKVQQSQTTIENKSDSRIPVQSQADQINDLTRYKQKGGKQINTQVTINEKVQNQQQTTLKSIEKMLRNYLEITKKIEERFRETQNKQEELLTLPESQVYEAKSYQTILHEITIDLDYQSGFHDQSDINILQEMCLDIIPEQKQRQNKFMNQNVRKLFKNFGKEQDSTQISQVSFLKQKRHSNQNQIKPMLQRYQSENPYNERQVGPINTSKHFAPYQEDQSNFLTSRNNKRRVQSRDSNKMFNVKQSVATEQNQENTIQQQINIKKKLNHARNLSDITSLSNIYQSDMINNCKRNQRVNKSLNIRNGQNQNIKINNFLQDQSKLNQQKFHTRENTLEQINQENVINREQFTSVLHQRSQITSFLQTFDTDIEQSNTFAQLIAKEVQCHQGSFLKDHIPNYKNLQFKQMYKATVDGFSKQSLQQSLKRQTNGQTLIFIQSEQDQVFGGYLSLPWPKTLGQYQDKQAFIFNLTKRTIFHKIKQKSKGYDNSAKNIVQQTNSYAFELNQFELFAFGDDIRIFENCEQSKTSFCKLGHTYAFNMKMSPYEKDNYMAGEEKFKVKEIIIYSLQKNRVDRY